MQTHFASSAKGNSSPRRQRSRNQGSQLGLARFCSSSLPLVAKPERTQASRGRRVRRFEHLR
eukprot:4720181-Pleurochrysis_carterae.AAC.3